MKLTKYDGLSIVLILFAVILSVLMYPFLPQEVPSHWNVQGEVDAWMPKMTVVILFPAVILGLYLLMLIIPAIAVHKKNIGDFKIYFEGLKFLLVLFLSVMYFCTLFVALGLLDSILPVVIVGLAVLFFFIGYILQFIKTNYFIGIRTPWTLANKTSWRKTHQLASVIFRVSGVLFLLGLLSPELFMWLVIAFVIVILVVVTVYSYVIYKREK